MPPASTLSLSLIGPPESADPDTLPVSLPASRTRPSEEFGRPDGVHDAERLGQYQPFFVLHKVLLYRPTKWYAFPLATSSTGDEFAIFEAMAGFVLV